MKVPKRVGSTLSHDRAPKQEKALGKRLGGSLVPRSGAGPVKGDVRVHGVVRIEAKTTAKKSFAITHHLIDQIEEAAASTGEIPVVQVQFINDQGTVTRSACIVPDWVLEEVVAYGLAKKRGPSRDGLIPGDAPGDLPSVAPVQPPERRDERPAPALDTRPRFSGGASSPWDIPERIDPDVVARASYPLKARKADRTPGR